MQDRVMLQSKGATSFSLSSLPGREVFHGHTYHRVCVEATGGLWLKKDMELGIPEGK